MFEVSMNAQARKPETVAAEALLTAANTIERLVEKEDYVGPHRTWRVAFNTAYDQNVEADTAGGDFDRVEDMFSEALIAALDAELAGENAAALYRNRAQAILD